MGMVWAEVFLLLPQTGKEQASNCRFTDWILWVMNDWFGSKADTN